MDRLKMLTLLALRSMVSHRVKNAIVSIIMIFGTALVVVGTSILDSVELSMQEGITSSATGHIQVFSKDAEDDLAIFGQIGAATTDIGEIDEFSRIEDSLLTVPGVVSVVPMALGSAVSFGKSELERVLIELRETAVASHDPERKLRMGEQQAHVRQIATLMLKQNENAMSISTDLERLRDERGIINRVLVDDFWVGLSDEPQTRLEYLDTKLAPLSTEGKLLYMRYIATDPTLFVESFNRFQIVDGQEIPKGTRGLLLSKRFYEKQVKSRVAREFDAIMEEIREGQSIGTDEVLQNRVKRMSRLASSVVYQFDAKETKQALIALAELMPGGTGGIEERMAAFLDVNDSNAEMHYEVFYDKFAPLIDVYDISIGDDVVLQAFTKSGYAKSVKVKVWGTFNFRGLETSDLAGAINVMDLITFRTLYGKMTAEQHQELDEIREQAGVREVSAGDAEEALFGDGDDIENETTTNDNVESPEFDVEIERRKLNSGLADTYAQDEIASDVILNAAVILDDPSRVEETIAAISALSDREGLNIQAIDWQAASGLVGQFILVISLVLYTAIIIIFTVALVIINNSMVMATMERIPEIGTMRAIGAQKLSIVLLTLLETTVLCLISGLIGAVVGTGIVALLGSSGIPAANDVMVFLFGGPRLYPVVGADNIILGVSIILIVSVVSTVYPALVAIRVQPAVAMRAKE